MVAQLSQCPDGTPYSNATFYIVDDYDRSKDALVEDHIAVFNQHELNCNEMRSLFAGELRIPAKSVTLPKGSTQSDWEHYWLDELKDKKAGDLMVIYSHGKAGGYRSNYQW